MVSPNRAPSITTPEWSPTTGLLTTDSRLRPYVNSHGVVKMTRTFLPLLKPFKGRVVILRRRCRRLSPFIAECSSERKALTTDPDVAHPWIVGLANECVSIACASGNLQEKFTVVGLSVV